MNFRDEFLNQTEQDDPKFPFAVVRNKTDLYDEGSSVTEQKSEQYFNEHFGGSTCKHFSTSAKVTRILVLADFSFSPYRQILEKTKTRDRHRARLPGKIQSAASHKFVYVSVLWIFPESVP